MKKIFNNLFFVAVLLSGFALVSCEEEGKLLEGTPVLSASSNIIVADGVDELVFTVTVNGTDVTADATIYAGNSPLEGNVFTTTKVGTYMFYASYNGKISNYFTATTANPALYIELPEDSQADKFDGFHRNILLTEATGTWCGYCPYMITALELFKESGSNAGNTVIVATHSGDSFANKASEAAVAAAKVSGFPSSVLNLNPNALIENAEPTVNAENINSMVGMELKEAARVGIAAATAANADNSVVAVRAAVKVGKAGSYRINAWLIEDGVAASQSSYWPEFSDGMASVIIDHQHILRAASNVTPIQGKQLGNGGKCEAGDVVEFYHEFNVAEALVHNLANCKIAVLVSSSASASSSQYFVNNIVECPVGESVPFAYK